MSRGAAYSAVALVVAIIVLGGLLFPPAFRGNMMKCMNMVVQAQTARKVASQPYEAPLADSKAIRKELGVDMVSDYFAFSITGDGSGYTFTAEGQGLYSQFIISYHENGKKPGWWETESVPRFFFW